MFRLLYSIIFILARADIVGIAKSERIRPGGHVERMDETRTACTILMEIEG
jgi:hypothetical protein